MHEHGFPTKESTITNLLEAVNDRTLTVVNSDDPDIAYKDFTGHF
jgi:hypothetical protein